MSAVLPGDGGRLPLLGGPAADRITFGQLLDLMQMANAQQFTMLRRELQERFGGMPGIMPVVCAPRIRSEQSSALWGDVAKFTPVGTPVTQPRAVPRVWNIGYSALAGAASLALVRLANIGPPGPMVLVTHWRAYQHLAGAVEVVWELQRGVIAALATTLAPQAGRTDSDSGNATTGAVVSVTDAVGAADPGAPQIDRAFLAGGRGELLFGQSGDPLLALAPGDSVTMVCQNVNNVIRGSIRWIEIPDFLEM